MAERGWTPPEIPPKEVSGYRLGWERPVLSAYTDPAELVWLHAARELGLRVERSADVYAASNGQGVLTLGSAETLDPDDGLPQMVLHELCHWIAEGPDSVRAFDWGFPMTDEVSEGEFVALRLQAWLADPHGLRELFAPTTDARTYYDQLVDPLAPLDSSERERRIVAAARAAGARAEDPFWAPIQRALAATATIAAAVAPFHSDYRSETAGDDLPNLWETACPESPSR